MTFSCLIKGTTDSNGHFADRPTFAWKWRQTRVKIWERDSLLLALKELHDFATGRNASPQRRGVERRGGVQLTRSVSGLAASGHAAIRLTPLSHPLRWQTSPLTDSETRLRVHFFADKQDVARPTKISAHYMILLPVETVLLTVLEVGRSQLSFGECYTCFGC